MTSSYAFELPRVLDSTQLNTARLCMQQFSFEYCYGLRPRSAAVDLHAGGAFAAGRAAAYQAAARIADTSIEVPAGLLPLGPADAARMAFTAAWGDFDLPADSKSPKTKQATWAALQSYLRQYEPGRDRLAPFVLPDGRSPFELPLSVELTEQSTGLSDWPVHPASGLPFVYAGKLDALCLLDGQIPVVLDDKTTARFAAAETWHAGLQQRAQFIGYVWLVQQLVEPRCDSVLVRQTAIRKADVEHRESPLISFPRHMVLRWLETTRDTVRRIVAAEQTGLWPAVLSDACVAWSRPCAYLAPCRARDPEAHFDSFEVRRWNPLSEPNSAESGAA